MFVDVVRKLVGDDENLYCSEATFLAKMGDNLEWDNCHYRGADISSHDHYPGEREELQAENCGRYIHGISEHDARHLPVKELNKLIKQHELSKDQIKEIKQERRKNQNRLYSQTGRVKKASKMNELGAENEWRRRILQATEDEIAFLIKITDANNRKLNNLLKELVPLYNLGRKHHLELPSDLKKRLSSNLENLSNKSPHRNYLDQECIARLRLNSI